MWTTIVAYVSKVSLKFWGVILAILAVVGWLFKMQRDAERRGAQKVKDKIRQKTDETREKWDEIDRSDPTVDDALDGLQRKPRRK